LTERFMRKKLVDYDNVSGKRSPNISNICSAILIRPPLRTRRIW
jgi:hypothetical protein